MKKTILMQTLLLWLVLPASAMGVQLPKTIPLSMMDKSVDDMYSYCNDTMSKKVYKYFNKENETNQDFKKAWKFAKTFAEKIYNTRKNKNLTKEQVQAICVYTQGSPKIYDLLNAAVREGAAKYTTAAFQYHALHYWLTTALQTLNKNKACRIVYRRTNDLYIRKDIQEMRFGYFVSASKSTGESHFGIKTCFHIKTCHGAYIKNYSKMSQEREVLIPPYEKFKIIKIAKGSYNSLTDCETIFVLESAGFLSKLDCKAARNH